LHTHKNMIRLKRSNALTTMLVNTTVKCLLQLSTTRAFSNTAEDQIAGLQKEIEELRTSLDDLRTKYDSVITEVRGLFYLHVVI